MQTGTLRSARLDRIRGTIICQASLVVNSHIPDQIRRYVFV